MSRPARHARLSATLAGLDDAALAALIGKASAETAGVGGGSMVLDIDGARVFAKRIPITDRELARPHSTANLFELPVVCQYGIVSPGFGAWRELAVTQAVSDGVLAGEADSFPLLYHWRVLPGRAPVAEEHLAVDAVVAFYGGDRSVRVRLTELADATASLVLFLEHVPRPLDDWLADDPVGRAPTLERQLAEITTFLRDRELLHMDGHFANMRADGERVYLVDFGLATSPRFDLSEAERDFAARHAGHDAAYAAMRLVNWLVSTVCGVPVDGPPVARNAYVCRCAAGDIPRDLPRGVREILARHSPAAARMNDFYWRLFAGELDTPYPA